MLVDKKLCVFCGSSSGNDTTYGETAFKLGKAMADKNVGLVYGGGTTGIMGKVANGCASNGGYVHGIIPDALISKERDDTKSNDVGGASAFPDEEEYGKTTMVKDMHTRKRMMGEEADAFVAMPGGYGTFEELLEVTTWYQLGIHKKPIVLFNIKGFYNTFLKFIDESVNAGFIAEKQRKLLYVADTVDEIFDIVSKHQHEEGTSFGLNWSLL